MTPIETEQTLRATISTIGKVPADFPLEADLYKDLGLDSFRMVEIFLAVEQRFGVLIEEDDYLSLRSLAHFLALLARAPRAAEAT